MLNTIRYIIRRCFFSNFMLIIDSASAITHVNVSVQL